VRFRTDHVLLHGWFVRRRSASCAHFPSHRNPHMNLTAFGLASLIGMAAAPVAAAEPAHPTIRHMAGAPVATSLDAAKTAVLVIDFQNEYSMPAPHRALPVAAWSSPMAWPRCARRSGWSNSPTPMASA
jgi:hypothetical protein